MKRPLPNREPARLTERDSSLESTLLRSASVLTPPTGTQQRIWDRLSRPHPRLIEQPEENAALVELLRSAAAVEPPAEAQAHIWQRMLEEARAREGIADPPRLLERWPFLARAAALEPPFGRQTRIFQSLLPARRPRFAFAAAGLSLAAAALMSFVRPPPAPHVASLNLTASNELRLVHAGTAASPNSLAVGDSVELEGTKSVRWQLSGVGDVVLDGTRARVTLASADEHGVRLNLDHGRIAIHADKRSHSAPLIIRSHGVDVQVVGTILAVDAMASGLEVSVREGLVRVSAPGHDPSFVGAGQHWSDTATLSSPWAGEAMKTLATTPPEARAVEVADGEDAPASDATSTPHTATTPQMTVTVPAGHPHTRKSPQYAALITPEPDAVTSPVTSEAQVQSALSAPFRGAPEGGKWNIDDDATSQWASTPAVQIESAINQMPRSGREDMRGLAIAYQALSMAPDADANERLRAQSRLAKVLDEDLGHPAQAVDIRRSQLNGLEGEDRSLARVEILADLVEMGRDREALEAAEACVRDCNAEHRVFAQVLQANLLIKAGKVDEARAVAKEARQTSGAYEKTAFFFSQRAQLFSKNSQRDRARFTAYLALRLDPRSPEATQLRVLARE